MRQYVRLSGVSLNTTGAVVAVDALDRAIGSIPGWVYLMDPEQISDAGAVLNRVDGVLKSPWNTDGAITPPYPDAPFAGFGTFAGGRPSIQLREVTRRSVLPDLAFPAAEWTVFSRVMLTTTSSNAQEVVALAPGVTVASGQFGPRMGFSTAGLSSRIWARGSAGDVVGDRRLTYTPAASFIGREVSMMWSFSASAGLSIYEDGIRVAHAPADAQVLTQATAAEQWRFFRGINADLGLTGILSVDLGRADMAGHRARLFAGLAAHYA